MSLTNLPIAVSSSGTLSDDECKSVLRRARFGHLAFARQTHVDAVPIQFALVDDWLYFRASPALRHIIGHNVWVLISVLEMIDATHFASVVARGACYPTDATGSSRNDAAALRGIIRLRERAPIAVTRARQNADRVLRTLTVFRLHISELRGNTASVPQQFSITDQLRIRASDRASRGGADNANYSEETGEQQ